MQILTPAPKYTEGMRLKALEQELRTGWQLKKELEAARETEARGQAQAMRNHRTIPGLGKCVAVMPDWDWFRVVQKFGRHEVHSKDFLRYYRRKFPDLCPNRV